MKPPNLGTLPVVLAILMWAGFHSVEAAASPKPNILFLMSDDHAAHASSTYGSRINQTPNLDRIAKGGIFFRNCFVNNSVCTPSRAAILKHLGTARSGAISSRPFDRMEIGDDSSNRVPDYGPATAWRGLIDDV